MMDKKIVIDLQDCAINHRRASGSKVSGDTVLTDIDLSVHKGELVYLIGKVGSGKSSFLKTLYCELPLTSGKGWIAGYDLRRIKRSEIPYLRRRIGMVFQDFQLLPDRNVYENLKFVLEATGWKGISIHKRIDEILTLIDLRHKAYKMPHHLSGGEQQRLVIGRAFLNNPDIILADEPTGNLDPESSEDIMNLFIELSDMGCTILLATHNIANLEQFPSRTLRFSEGYIEEVDIFAILGLEEQPKVDLHSNHTIHEDEIDI